MGFVGNLRRLYSLAISELLPQTAYMSTGRAAAVRAAQARMGELGLTQEALAKRSGLDLSTVNTFVNGHTWPQVRTRAKLETALEWPVGQLGRIASGSDAASDDREAELRSVRKDLEALESALRRALERLERLT